MGDCRLEVKRKGQRSAISDLRMSGCVKVLFSRNTERVDAIVINSSGGLTSGDRITSEVNVGSGACAAVTTQAAERAYRATDGVAQVSTQMTVAAGGKMMWLPQELILFDGAQLDRCLTCDLEPEARLLLVEPVIFGRAQMGETLRALSFQDRIKVDRGSVPLYRDSTRLTPDALARLAVTNGAGAMANVIYANPDAEAQYCRVLDDLPPTSGASLLREDVLALRLLAADGFELRRILLPILDRLTGHTLPTSWRL